MARSCSSRTRFRLICSMFTLGKLAIYVLVVVQLPLAIGRAAHVTSPVLWPWGFPVASQARQLYGVPHLAAKCPGSPHLQYSFSRISLGHSAATCPNSRHLKHLMISFFSPAVTLTQPNLTLLSIWLLAPL